MKMTDILRSRGTVEPICPPLENEEDKNYLALKNENGIITLISVEEIDGKVVTKVEKITPNPE